MGLSPVSASCIAALCTRIILHPLDTIRIKTQLGKRIQIKDSYKGLGIALIFSVPGLSAYLATYDKSKEIIGNHVKQEILVHGLAAVCAEVVSGVFWTPMEIIKAKQQSGSCTGSTMKLAKDIYTEHGFRGFYRGYVAQLYVCYFLIYEKLKKEIPARGVVSFILCSGVAAGFAGVVSNTIDVLKTRMQVEGKTLGVVAREAWKQNGLKMITLGLGTRVLWIIPSVTASMTIYESLKAL